jgi:hypothetical protein
VPALTFSVSTNFVFANLLASRSFGNVSVTLACFRFPGGNSNETYHVPWDLLAMRPRAGYAGRLALLAILGPDPFAADAFEHAYGAAAPGIQQLADQPGLSAAAVAPAVCGNLRTGNRFRA